VTTEITKKVLYKFDAAARELMLIFTVR